MASETKRNKLNPTKESLSIEKLKTFKGFETLTDEQAQEIIFEVKKLVSILIEYVYEHEKVKEEEFKIKPAA